MIKLRPILLVNGILLCILAAAMLIPAAVDHSYGHRDSIVFLRSFYVTVFVGGTLYFTNRGYRGHLGIREAFLLTVSCWLSTSLFAALPLFFSEMDMSYTDAVFEAVSGLTTTGSTVLVGLDHAPPGVLLWRSLLQGLGGMGIIVLGILILPVLQIGGMQLFHTESSEKSEKILPRAHQVSAVIIIVYFSLVALCSFFLWLFGMSGFDAICHAFAAISTGGFSTKDMSLAYYDSAALDYTTTAFMISGALPFVLYYHAVNGRWRELLHDVQVRWFLALLTGSILLMTLWLYLKNEQQWDAALRYAAFNVTSIMTTTGFASADYNQWGNFAVTFFFMITVMGGCTGSTSGGIKIFRYKVLYETAKAQICRLIQPHGVFRPRYGNKSIEMDVGSSVLSFFILFAFSFLVLSLGLSFFGLDFVTSMSASATALANTGPGLGNIIGPAGNFATLPDSAKWLLVGGMVLGRLELFTVIVLFMPRFWKN